MSGVIRVEKTRGYTVMSNHHLRDKGLSLKSKGLLSVILSLPDGWDYTVEGLAAICLEGRDAVRSAIQELEAAGYVRRERVREKSGRLGGCDYTVFEMPQTIEAEPQPATDFPTQARPAQARPAQGPPTQSSNDGSITEESNTDGMGRGRSHRLGPYGNVALSDGELSGLRRDFPSDWQARVDHLSEYMAMTGKAYEGSHDAVIRSWARQDAAAAEPSGRVFGRADYRIDDGEAL